LNTHPLQASRSTMDLPSPSAYKISTITATGGVNTTVKLDVLFDNVILCDPHQDAEGIVYAEFGSRKTETIHKGHAKKLTVAHRKPDIKKKRFDNQVTLVYRYREPKLGMVMVNSKVFKNGHVQMTGLKYIDQGKDVVDRIISTLRTIHKVNPEVVEDVEKLENVDYVIRLINCDFKVGFEIRREKLHTVMTHKHGVMCTFEPCIYPGCKIQYCYNTAKKNMDGICNCKKKCNGKGCGHGDGSCKKITIAVFQSGCVIITGGQSIEQIERAYRFAVDSIFAAVEIIKKPPLCVPAGK